MRRGLALAAIKIRADRLAGDAVNVWTAPRLAPEVLDEYRPKVAAVVGGYTIEDHRHLLNATTGALFDAFRKAVLALDPCVSEQFMKLYVAYKAETNFVDVVPQATKLRLALNMDFAEINDPKGLCMDVTGKGRWGNGDVEVVFSDIDQLPYVLGLVRQSLELQLGNGGES